MPEADAIKFPIDYFRIFFDDSILEHIVEQSNLFSVQSNINRPLQLTKDELEQFLGIVLYISVYHLPCTRMYLEWQVDWVMLQLSCLMVGGVNQKKHSFQ